MKRFFFLLAIPFFCVAAAKSPEDVDSRANRAYRMMRGIVSRAREKGVAAGQTEPSSIKKLAALMEDGEVLVKLSKLIGGDFGKDANLARETLRVFGDAICLIRGWDAERERATYQLYTRFVLKYNVVPAQSGIDNGFFIPGKTLWGEDLLTYLRVLSKIPYFYEGPRADLYNAIVHMKIHSVEKAVEFKKRLRGCLDRREEGGGALCLYPGDGILQRVSNGRLPLEKWSKGRVEAKCVFNTSMLDGHYLCLRSEMMRRKDFDEDRAAFEKSMKALLDASMSRLLGVLNGFKRKGLPEPPKACVEYFRRRHPRFAFHFHRTSEFYRCDDLTFLTRPGGIFLLCEEEGRPGLLFLLPFLPYSVSCRPGEKMVLEPYRIIAPYYGEDGKIQDILVASYPRDDAVDKALLEYSAGNGLGFSPLGSFFSDKSVPDSSLWPVVKERSRKNSAYRFAKVFFETPRPVIRPLNAGSHVFPLERFDVEFGKIVELERGRLALLLRQKEKDLAEWRSRSRLPLEERVKLYRKEALEKVEAVVPGISPLLRRAPNDRMPIYRKWSVEKLRRMLSDIQKNKTFLSGRILYGKGALEIGKEIEAELKSRE